MYALMVKDPEGGVEITIHNVLDDAQDQFDETRIKSGWLKVLVQVVKAGKPFGVNPSGGTFGCEELERN